MEKLLSGQMEILGYDTPNTGVYISQEDLAKFKPHILNVKSFLEDHLDQNMVNYCDFIALVDLVELLTNGSKNKNFVNACQCSK